jgi:hypothetical protein
MNGRIILRKALAATFAVLVAQVANAAPGDGIRLGGGEARLHPFLDLETRYDSNVSYTGANQAIGDVILHVRPGLELKAAGDVATVEFSGALDWAQYLGVEGDTTSLSKLYATAGFAALFNRQGSVSPRLDNSFTRQVSTTSLAASSTAVISNLNTLSLSLPWKPGGGALVVAANAQWTVEAFETYKDVPAERLSELGYNQYRFGGDALWRFLPRTSGILQAGYFTRQPNRSNRPDQASGFDALAGLTGLLTPRISATAKVGFGSTSSEAVKDNTTGAAVIPAKTTSTVVSDVGLEWLPLQSISIRGGYTRGVGLDPTAATYVADGVSGGFRLKVAQQVAVRTDVRYDHLSFRSNDATTSFLRIDPGVDAAVGKWLSLGLGYVYSMRTASWPAGTAPPDYSKNEVFLKAAFTY